MPLSNDPVRRAKQLDNLRPAGAVKHGATSEGKLKPLRARHRAELLQRFPQLDEQRRSLLADLLARIDLAGEFIDVHGLMRNTRETHPLLELLSRWERRAWDMLSQLAPKVKQSGRGWVNEPMLRIELTADERVGMMATDEKIRMETVRRILTRSREEQQRGTATSLRRTTMREEWDGRPPEQLSARDRTQEDLATLEELIDEAEGLQGRG